MPGLSATNALINRDEGLHCKFACHLNKKLLHPASPLFILEIFKSAVDLEKDLVHAIFERRLFGMNTDLMCQYVEFCGDVLLSLLGIPKYYTTPNPFEFMEVISLGSKSNFFERRVTEYTLTGIQAHCPNDSSRNPSSRHNSGNISAFEFALDEHF